MGKTSKGGRRFDEGHTLPANLIDLHTALIGLDGRTASAGVPPPPAALAGGSGPGGSIFTGVGLTLPGSSGGCSSDILLKRC